MSIHGFVSLNQIERQFFLKRKRNLTTNPQKGTCDIRAHQETRSVLSNPNLPRHEPTVLMWP